MPELSLDDCHVLTSRPNVLIEGPEAATEAMLSIQEQHDEVRQLIALGKRNGYLLYEEVNELLPSDISSAQVQKQIDAVRSGRAMSEKLEETLRNTPKGATAKDQQQYRRARWAAMRARIECANDIRKIAFTEAVKRRLIDEMKHAGDSVQHVQREIGAVGWQLNPKNNADGTCADKAAAKPATRPKDATSLFRFLRDGETSAAWHE
jgi:hypothetical protein